MATFGQGAIGWVPAQDYDSGDCTGDGSCLAYGPADAAGLGGSCFIGYLPLAGLGLEMNCTTSIQPTVSIPVNISQFYYLSEPYSYEASVAQINAQGPTSLPRFNVSADPQNCFVQIGMDWQTYIENCVDLPAPTGTAIDTAVLDAGLVGVTTPLTFNQVNESKALAAHTHDLETYQFNIVGVGLNWTDETVEANPQAIVNDQDLPSVTDTVQATINSWGTNLYDKGTPINDTSSGAYTGQGSAYVYRQWAQLVQASLNSILAATYPNNTTTVATTTACSPTTPCTTGTCSSTTGAGVCQVTQSIYNHVIGDPACFVPPQQANAAGCTGMEGLILQSATPTTACPAYGDPADTCATSPAPICNNYGAYCAGGFYGFGDPGYGATVLRPGGLLGVFCQNPPGVGNTSDPHNGSCSIYELWTGALTQVQNIAGLGNLKGLPTEIADVRFYFRWYGVAMIQYLKAYGANPNATAADVAAQTVDLESMFFDTYNNGGGGYNDVFEYVERSFMTNTPATYVGNAPGSASTPGAVTVSAAVNAEPTDFSLNAILLSADEQGSNWSKFLYRPERAMFTAMLEKATDLPGSENNVNITNLAGSTMLQQDYASYQCATQYPLLTPIAGTSYTQSGTWQDLCASSCVAGPSNGVPCPKPPLNPPDSSGNQTLQLDLNGQNPGIGLATTNPRLANYKAVWGPGNACPNGSSPNYALNPNASKNPYNPSGCSVSTFVLPVPTGVGSVFSVGQRPQTSARLSYVGADGTHPDVGTNTETLTAYVNVPNMTDPYNATTMAATPNPILSTAKVTVPWIGKYDNVGFSVPINGQQDKFYPTEAIDFSGILLSYALDVVPWADPITHVQDGTLTVEAIEGGDFLGEAFLCQDIGGFPTPGTGDLLGVHMYDSAASILTWITNHPGSEDACNIIVRYSPYDNYIDFITSLSAGVQVDINQGGGYGRVVGVIAFDPNLSEAP